MRIVRTETYEYWGALIREKYIDCDHDCSTCDEKCKRAKKCPNCGGYYDTEEYEYCPECGYDPFVEHDTD